MKDYFYLYALDPVDQHVVDEYYFDDEVSSYIILSYAEKFSDIVVIAGWTNCSDFRLIVRRGGKTISFFRLTSASWPVKRQNR